ncbi:MAG TPA: tetratricopeptide repeat protein, partial [Kofleriaceae bacterium]
MRISSVVIIVLVAALAPALGQPSEPTLGKPTDSEAARLYREGNEHYKLGLYARAIEHYAASIALEESQAALYNIAQSHRQLGQHKEAVRYYRRLVDSTAIVGSAREHIEALIAAANSAVDKQTPPPPPPPPVVRDADVTDDVSDDTAVDAEDDVPELQQQGAWYHDWVGWSLAGTGVLASGVAIGFALRGEQLQADANGEPDELAREQLQTRADSRRTWALATAMIGGGLTIAGIVKLAVNPRSVEELTVSFGASS